MSLWFSQCKESIMKEYGATEHTLDDILLSIYIDEMENFSKNNKIFNNYEEPIQQLNYIIYNYQKLIPSNFISLKYIPEELLRMNHAWWCTKGALWPSNPLVLDSYYNRDYILEENPDSEYIIELNKYVITTNSQGSEYKENFTTQNVLTKKDMFIEIEYRIPYVHFLIPKNKVEKFKEKVKNDKKLMVFISNDDKTDVFANNTYTNFMKKHKKMPPNHYNKIKGKSYTNSTFLDARKFDTIPYLNHVEDTPLLKAVDIAEMLLGQGKISFPTYMKILDDFANIEVAIDTALEHFYFVDVQVDIDPKLHFNLYKKLLKILKTI